MSLFQLSLPQSLIVAAFESISVEYTLRKFSLLSASTIQPTCKSIYCMLLAGWEVQPITIP